MLTLRPLAREDLPAVAALEAETYPPALLEGEEEFAAKLDAFRPGAVGAFDDGALAAYLFCHPGTVGEIYRLGSGRPRPPAHPDCLYIHDLAVHAGYRGKGLAGRLLGRAYRMARGDGLAACAVVSVLGSEPFWRRQGFSTLHELEYREGVPARYMVRKLE